MGAGVGVRVRARVGGRSRWKSSSRWRSKGWCNSRCEAISGWKSRSRGLGMEIQMRDKEHSVTDRYS